MAKITAIINGEKTVFEVPVGTKLLDALGAHAFPPPSDCGGRGSCGKCRVKLLEGNAETDKDGYFLSCRHIVTADLAIAYEVYAGAGLTRSRGCDFYFEPREGYGIAADIGTTTLAVYLVDLASGEVADAVSEANAQKLFGGDVISRIKAASEGKTAELQRRVIKQLDHIAREMLAKRGILEARAAYVAGNTTMQHLFAGVNPETMGVIPFAPVFMDTKQLCGANLGLSSIKEVTLMPSASAYIGADVIAGIVSSGMQKYDNAILADIGTNCEIILKCGNRFFAAAAAAGPAFEGAGIEMGMPGVLHAIDKVYLLNGSLGYTTLGGEAKGICGSGLADAIAVMLALGVIDGSGAFEESNPYNAGGKFYISSDVYISQKDVRAFQLAKSAVCSAIEKLIHVSGLSIRDIDKLYIAGGFGYYLDKTSAAKTGIIPPALVSKAEASGNTSGLGARMCLLNPAYLRECERLAKEVEVVELAGDSYFTAALMDNIMFGDF